MSWGYAGLEKQLAAMTEERDDHIGLTHMALDERDEYLRQLDAMTKLWENEYRLRCEAQAREKVLIEAAQAVVDRWESPLWKVQESTASFIYTLQKALALPADDTALMERLKDERERCIETMFAAEDVFIAAAIKALDEK